MKEKSFKVNIIDSRVSKPKSSNKQAIRHGADVVSMARAMEINQGRNQLEMRRENNIGETSTDPSNPPPIIMRHRLKSRLATWATFVRSVMVLNWIANGFKLEFKNNYQPPPFEARNHQSAFDYMDFVDKNIMDLLSAQSIAIFPGPGRPHIVCPFGVIEQKDKLRMIYDARYINQFLDFPKFKYEDLSFLDQFIEPNDYQWTTDFTKGYHHVDIHPDSFTFLGFKWRGTYYVWQSLPFGLAPACWVFTKITRELLGKWRRKGHRCSGYIDDINNVGSNAEKLKSFMEDEAIPDMKACGFLVNEKKSMKEPKQQANYLGMIIDTVKGCMIVPTVRKEKIIYLLSQALANNQTCNYNLLEKITGCLNSMHWAFGDVVSTMTRMIYSSMNKTPITQSYVNLTKGCVAEMKFWLEGFDKFNGHRRIWKRKDAPFIITTDASGNNPRNNGAWAAWTYIHGQIAIARGAWMRETDEEASAYLELDTIHNAIKSYNRINILSGRRVRIRTDSQNVFYVITNSRSKSDKLHALYKHIYWYCFRNEIELEAEWIPREKNEFADWYSKLIEPHDVKLNPIIFKSLQRRWGKFSIDLFASHENYQMLPYFSRYWTPNTHGVNAFNFKWPNYSYANPPFKLIAQVIDYAQEQKLQGLCLLLPFWTSAIWWNKLSRNGTQFSEYIVDYCFLPKWPNLFANNQKTNKNWTAPRWDTIVLLLDFSRDNNSLDIPHEVRSGMYLQV